MELRSHYAVVTRIYSDRAILARARSLRFVMTLIVLRCPKTHKDILPGIHVTDFRSAPTVAQPIKCPICGDEHSWLPYAADAAEAIAKAFGSRETVKDSSCNED